MTATEVPVAPTLGNGAQTLIVTGMHRSGTSVLTECLTALGWCAPHDRGAPSFDNPRGHFEPAAIVALNDAALAETGSNWSRFSPLSNPETDHLVGAGYVGQIDAALADSFAGQTSRIIKDPRIALLSPLWRVWMERQSGNVAVLVALRKPQAVAQSLVARDGLSPIIAHLLWIGHTLGALRLAARRPHLIVRFPQWVANPTQYGVQMSRFAANPGLGPDIFGAAVRRCYLPDAIHAEGSAAIDQPATDDVMALAEDIYAVAADWSVTETEPDAERLEAWTARFDAVRAVASAVEHHGQMQALRSAERVALATAQHRADVARLARVLAENSALASEHAARGAASSEASAVALREAADENNALRQMLDDAERQRDALSGHVAEVEHRLCTTQTALAQAISDSGAALAAAQRERDEAHRLARTVERGRARIHRLSRERILLVDSLMGTAERLHQTDAKLGALTAQAEASSVSAHAFQAALHTAEARIAALSLALTDTQIAALATKNYLNTLLRNEEMTILRPIYRRIYRFGGRQLRRVMRDAHVNRLKRHLPGPGGIPAALVEVVLPSNVAETVTSTVDARQGDLPDIYILSIINWDFRTQRPQHLARDWARRGHRVIYVEMESDLSGPTVRRLAPHLHVIRLGVPADDLIPTYRGVPDARQIAEWVERLLRFGVSVGGSPHAHLVIQHPYWWPFAQALPGMFTLTFDCMDEIAGFSNTEAHMLDAEQEMIAQADHMIVSAQYLFDKHSATRPVTLVRNAADTGHFLRDSAPPAPDWVTKTLSRNTPGIKVGYVGAIAEWFDVALVAGAAALAPDMQFYLCGAVTEPAALSLRDLPNVTLHGEIPYADAPGFLAAMDVMTIPFRLLPIIQACDPVKFYEYAAAGKPVVATNIPELDRAGDLVQRVADAPELVKALRAAAIKAQDSAHVAALKDYARGNTWADRGAAFLTAILPAPKVSVVILAYGDPSLTVTTLHSLTGRGPVYPVMEIIVVDNGSPPEAVAALRACLADLPDARLIENGRNLGFAGGNNVGIATATGDYVLLLNNDTYVAPGAISAMVRHLERHPQIGVVGPMTNNIGNEARIEVHYADMAEMVRAAWSVTTGYRGQWTEIGVAAYFCAMFRRDDLAHFGPLDETFGRGMFEDDDHCARIRAQGYVCALAEDAFVHHHLSATFDQMGQDAKRALFERNRAIFEARWGAWTPHRYRDARPARVA